MFTKFQNGDFTADLKIEKAFIAFDIIDSHTKTKLGVYHYSCDSIETDLISVKNLNRLGKFLLNLRDEITLSLIDKTKERFDKYGK